ncbi:MAG TPA: hypothetical protein VMB52_01190 [Verrucomicrobiae bacterium]|nr:hypothetical protein [Verrucomicrobiae bacterium]
MKRIKFYITALGLFLGLGLVVAVPLATVAASPQSTVCSTLGAGSNCSSTPTNGVDVNSAVTSVVNILSSVVGIIAVIMIIIAGIRFMTANGNSSNIASARSTMIYALVGLVVVAFAQVIVNYVLDRI